MKIIKSKVYGDHQIKSLWRSSNQKFMEIIKSKVYGDHQIKSSKFF